MTDAKVSPERRKKITSVLIIIFILFFSNIYSQQDTATAKIDSVSKSDTFNQAVNFCPGGIVFGIYAFNYEYLLNNNHGLVARFDYEIVSETLSDDKMEAKGYAFTFNYRWHFSGKMESFYIGSYLRYKHYDGDATDGAAKFDFKINEYTLGLNAGKRWVWNSGININAAFGYGISQLDKETDPATPSNEAQLDKFIDEYDFIGPFYGEISIGYAF